MFDSIQHNVIPLTLRQRGVTAEVRLDGEYHEMHDWSMSGVSFETPAAPLKEGEAVKLTLRFHLPHESIGVWVDGRVIRSDAFSTAVEFGTLTSYAERRLARVIDGLQPRLPDAMLMPFHNL